MATLNKSDLEFILQQILIAEADAAGADLATLLPNSFAPFGLRTVDGSLNNVVTGQSEFGAADNLFPRLVDPVFRDDADGDTFDANGPAPNGVVTNTDYGTPGNVADADPRLISNLIVDMNTATNPAAAAADTDGDGVVDSNVTPDEGLSAPFNSWFTFFGQFFDHGLDLVNKGGNGTIFMPLQPDDPLYVEGSNTNFMVLARATPDGTEHTNQTTPFVDQNQTYTSHPSHQVFLREYELNADGEPVATGRLLDAADGGISTWADVKAQALNMLGIQLTVLDVVDLPLLRTDAYGKFVPGENGFAQIITGVGLDGIANTSDDAVLEGDPTANGGLGTSTATALRTGHAFLNDIAHSANPVNSQTGAFLPADDDGVINDFDPTTPAPPPVAGTYDNELLDRHFITGDGRGNENIALTAVHHVFHSEHNRQVDEIKATILATGDADFIASWQLSAGVWDGERVFQAARFATEMQYQHLVFEEFARKMQPAVDEFLPETNYDTTINPAIVAEFAHAVFRVGHSMLTDTVDRLDPNFASSEISLLDAFLNPVAFNNDGTLSPEQAAGAIVRGMTRQQGNEIDEFVTDAVRNTLLGLPLDLPAINIARGRDTGIPTLNAARREFYDVTSDPQLQPYTSWVDLTQNLKHPESAINFIAAYGTHAELIAEDVNTLAEKRAVATALVFGGTAVINEGALDERTFTADDTDRLAFLNSTGDYALDNGVTTTGVDAIDLWIGGLAEKQMPFGGLLGSTFNFVFETQMENLQNGDRFYYLSRLAGLNFLTEMENNSFAKLVMLNTDATHLPASIFTTPNWTLEANPDNQFTGLGVDGRDDPTEGGTDLIPLVIRDNPATPGPDANYLQYTGVDHVVLGGTAGNETLIASIGDDTLWGDGGNDRLEAGDGADNVEGGDGDDIITDLGGDDVLKGNDGNDVIHGGNGANLILGGAGSDFIVTGEDVSEVFAGPGNDFILGSKTNLPTFGNEGDDWIELGTQDGTTGDSFDPLALDPIIGNDVLISGGGFDELIGEGGDDIFAGSDGEDHFDGGSGFDWAIYKFDELGVTANMLVNDLIEPPVAPSNAGIMDRFAFTEGLSGSAFGDVLRGDNADAGLIATAGATGSVLTNIGLIDGLQAIVGAGVTSFNGGNIILGGDGSDIIEGRMGDDIIDGDAWLDVRIAVSGHPTITSVDSMKELVPYMLSGAINPSQLSIVREILTAEGPDFDTAMFSGPRANYTIITAADGTTVVSDNVGTNAGTDGTDTLRHIERLQFSDQAVVLAPGLNNEPVGLLTINDDSPAVNQLLTALADDVTDADNPGTGAITGGPISHIWQFEAVAGTGIFQDIVALGGGSPSTAAGNTFRVTADLDGLALRVRAVYQDANGVLENVFSTPTAPVAGVIAVAPVTTPPAETPVTSPGNGVHLIRADLQFILDQIKIAEADADGADLLSLLPNSRVAFGLRTVDGSFNNLVRGQEQFGAADQDFPLLLDQVFRDDLDGDTFDANGPGPGGVINNTNYASTIDVVDEDPRIISNLIVDQTANNPAAVAANGGNDPIVSPGLDGMFGTADDREVFFIPNTTPDEGLSAQFNAWFTFFGQFFDHGLDLVDKGSNGTVFMPLQADDPLIAGADGEFGTADDLPASQRFMVLTRATNTAVQAGLDGVFGTSDDVHFHNNETTPFVDQNQTYTSHASHQVFLREYASDATGRTVNTGRLIDGANGGIGNWEEVKAQAAQLLGIQLTDADIFDVPLLATDLYGNFLPGEHGFAQLITNMGMIEGVAGGLDLNNLPGGAIAGRTGHAFLNDIAHNAVPGTVFDTDGNPATPGTSVVQADDDDIAGSVIATDFAGRKVAYDDELLDRHFLTGDGRGNENIGLTTVHFVFHAEHNRLVEHIKDVAIASNDVSFLNEWLTTDVAAIAVDPSTLVWDGERLFQAARFGTEMQYQHLVFEEFARKVQPQVDIFFAATQVYDSTINPAIVAEFAHQVYRFGHSMLLETVDRFDPNFDLVNGDTQQIGLIAAFLNPLEFTASGLTDEQAAGAIVRGLTRQAGNEIDEFVTEALRNNLLGLPLDLPSINLARGRDTGVPTLNQARAEFYAMTGDSQLAPYTSWVDFAAHIKHMESLVNFIAAYGTHAEFATADVDTHAEKRAVATALVFGGDAIINAGTPDERTFTADEVDRLAFLNSTGAYANAANGVTTTGVDAIDLWVGGLAEKQMPFGGLLGSTFNFVFEEQMEKLQDGDRFYYLERTQGLNFLSELENNSFAKLVMANTDATHLPGDIFSTPAFILEVDPLAQFTGLGPDGRDDPADVVIRNNPGTETPDPNYLQYAGEDHVVLGGTAGNDTIISSIGDDTLYGDAGNDRLEGGDGVDMILGGPGDDIITDLGGDDNLQGQDGNDAIHGGNGLNLILGGFGNDFIVTGEDPSEAFGGPGNDFILGARANEFVFGNEGDDWIEHGMADGSAGENFDAFSRDTAIGHDVFIGNSISDRMDGEGGDDIMVGNGGQVDRYVGMSGFDWAVFKDDQFGVTADLLLRAFDETPVPLSNATVLARFESMEGLSGSAFGDVLQGDDFDAVGIAASGATGSVLTQAGIDLIDGLQALLGDGVTSFGAGNIILGGDGSDMLEGRGGDDIIDGDAWLNVRISVRANADGTGGQIATFDSMTDPELQANIFSGAYNPGQLTIVREILMAEGPDFDTAKFSGELANYTIETLDDGTILVTDTVGADGTDTVRNIERFQFSDQALVFGGFNAEPEGVLTISDNTPTEDQQLTVSAAGVTDLNGIVGPIAFFWQSEVRPGVFEDILIENAGGEEARATGLTFTPGDLQVGLALRVRAVFKDGNDVLEEVFSAATAPVANVNDAPIGTVVISDPAPTETQALVAINQFTDADGLAAAVFSYQWQQNGLNGVGDFADIAGATAQSFTPGEAQVDRELRVVLTYVDGQGTTETVISAATDPVANANDAPVGTVLINDTTPTETEALIAINAFVDNDGLAAAVFTSTWQSSADGVTWTDVGTGTEFTSGEAEVGLLLRVVATYTDDQGTTETVTSAPTGIVGDSIITGAGRQDIYGTEGDDILFLGAGNDFAVGHGGDDIINGEAGNDALIGGAGNDKLNGGAGNDTLGVAGGDSGDDIMTGGTGNDAYIVEDTGDVVIENAGEGTDTVRTSLSSYMLSANVDNLVFIGAGGFTGTGNDLNNSITGGDGNDRLDGGLGADKLVGGLSNDTYVIDNVLDRITDTGGLDTVESTLSSFTLATGLENLVFTDTGNFSGTGNGSANMITGGSGNDTLSGLGHTDTLIGGAGNDTLTGGTGNDALSGEAGNDIFNYTFGDGADTVDGGADSDTLNILGTAAANTLDVIFDGTVVTQFEGGTLTVTNVESVTADLAGGMDKLTYAGTTTAVAVNLSTGAASGFTSVANIENVTGGAGADTLTGDGLVNNLNGGSGNDTVFGLDGADTLLGGAGVDRLVGGAGNDTMNGGADNDVFVFASGFGNDTIQAGFDANVAGGQDLLDISALGITAANFAASVSITVSQIDGVGALDTLVTIGADSIALLGVNGVGANAITQADYILA